MGKEIVVLEKETSEVVLRAGAIVVKDDDTYQKANLFINKVKTVAKEVKDTFLPILKKAHEAHKEAKAQEKKYLLPLQEAERLVKQKTTEYYFAKEKKRREEELRLQKIAEEKARKERERLEERARKAAEKGKVEKAEELKEKAEIVVPAAIKVVPSIPKQEGVIYRDKWTAEVVDFALLPDVYKIPNLVMLDRVAKSMKGQVPISGVKFKCEKIQANRI